MEKRTVVIVGGGIAGVSCLEGLLTDYDEDDPQFNSIYMISDNRLVKKTADHVSSGRNLDTFRVVEDDACDLLDGRTLPTNLSFKFIIGRLENIDTVDKTLSFSNHNDRNLKNRMRYDTICICCGSRPKELAFTSLNIHPGLKSRLIVIRDTTTVISLQQSIKNCQHIVIVGNGGISLELVYKITGCDKTWIIKDGSIGMSFFDSGASKFFLDREITTESSVTSESKSTPFESSSVAGDSIGHNLDFGPSLGPHWLDSFNLEGRFGTQGLEIIYKDEVVDISYDEHNLSVIVKTKEGRIVNCDLVALAIGVIPNLPQVLNKNMEISKRDGGILIDDQMRTSLPDIYAAGDVVSCDNWPKSNLWFQKRLWTQARQMGFYAGRCIASHLSFQDPSLYFNFDCFTHCTTFFGKKLILLGRYNGQDLSDEEVKGCEVIAKVVEGKEYVKLLIRDNRIIGAVMIGNSCLEETIENLILDQIDVSRHKDRLLDGSVDIEDYFD